MIVNVLSAGAVSPGLSKVIERFRRDRGCEVNVTFATAPAIRNRIDEGTALDIVIAPVELLDELLPNVKTTVPIGQIGVGVAIRNGAATPKIATVPEFTQTLLEADSVVYNQASTGTYLERLFETLTVSDRIKGKTTRYPDFAAVRNHVANGKGNEIGLGATTVIIESREITFAGPLPEEIQNYTTYAAKLLADDSKSDATALFRFLAESTARALFNAAGIA